MRLLTHNFLQSTVKGVTNGYPLQIVAERVQLIPSPYDATLLETMLHKIQYPSFLRAVSDLQSQLPETLSIATLPETLNDSNDTDDDQQQQQNELDDDNNNKPLLYTLLFDVHVLDGTLICPATQRRFPIKNGIPNMILHEDEV